MKQRPNDFEQEQNMILSYQSQHFLISFELCVNSSIGWDPQHTSAHDLVVSTDNQRQRFSIELMFLFEHARCQSFLRVVIQDRHMLLRDDRSAIESFIDEVNRATGRSRRMVERLLLRIETWK